MAKAVIRVRVERNGKIEGIIGWREINVPIEPRWGERNLRFQTSMGVVSWR